MNTKAEAAGDVKWVKSFVSKTFFGACGAHNGFHGNENKYCINCEQAACSHCLAEGRHANHKVIKIFRLVYMDVVSMDEMTAFLDCSKIQPYTSNGKQVFALSPLPHQGSGKLKLDTSCNFCARKLMNPARCTFCSIACKVQHMYEISTNKPTTKVPKTVRPVPENGRVRDPVTNNVHRVARVNRKKQPPTTSRRKGIPVRAPPF
uniref:B box-type domain-containing protein n=1 Tax=Lactuca sativa TaxID=4236 RepID=A0A9R1XNQ9_LACSA|nr:hypothetical protein LSAT_V11C300127030 [Lactuca sativa]